MISPPPTTAEDAVTDQLRRLIVEGALPPGSRLTVAALSARLGVSATPLRAALRLLEGEGLVESHAHLVARVRELTPHDIRNLYRLRGAVLGLLVPDVVRHVSDADIEVLAELDSRFQAAARDGNTPAAMAANEAFHRALLGVARNPDAGAVMARSWALVEALRLRLGFGPGRLVRSVESHRALLKALRARDAARATALMVASSDNAMVDLLERAMASSMVAPRRARS